MTDPRYDELAEVLVRYSCKLQPGEKVLIEAFDIPEAFTRSLIRAAAAAGGHPLVTLKSNAILRDLMLVASHEQMELMGSTGSHRMRQVQAYIGVRGQPNVSEWQDVPPERMALYETLYRQPTHIDLRVKKTRWVVLRWPSASMAQQAAMSTESFEDFFFRVCTLDYARLSRAMQPLRDLVEKTDRVRIVAPGTDLSFSIRDIPAVCCDGLRNIPDGEVYTAPVKDSVNGTISFNAPTIYQGVSHENVRLILRDGRVVEATSTSQAHLDAVLNADAGARFFGEFALGLNPHIKRPMKDILFDEKIAGSIHLALGNAYDVAWNGNSSQIHWDLVLLMDPEAGGGEVYFDDQLIRRDGRFIAPELAPLNPEQLLAAEAAG